MYQESALQAYRTGRESPCVRLVLVPARSRIGYEYVGAFPRQYLRERSQSEDHSFSTAYILALTLNLTPAK